MRRVPCCRRSRCSPSSPRPPPPPPPRPAPPGSAIACSPTLGNGGYDVLHYDLDLRYATSAPSQPIDGTVTILARATQSLSRFDLDFAGDERRRGRRSNGAPAAFRRDGEELVITPRKPIRNGDTFLVRVSHFVAVPTAPDDDDSVDDGVLLSRRTARRRRRSRTSRTYFLPSNDHPRDKATFTSASTSRPATTAVANGVLVGAVDDRGRTHWVYVQRQPMATELIQLAVGNYDVTPPGRPSRRAAARRHRAPITDARSCPTLALHAGPRSTGWRSASARYPFDLYGSLVVRGRPRLRAGDADARADRHVAGSTTRPRACGSRRCCTRCRTCGSATASSPYDVERPVAQRGPRELVRVPLRRGERRARGRHRGLARRDRLRHARRADEGRLRARRPVARTTSGRSRPADQRRRRHAVRLPGLPRRRARPLRAAPEDRRARRSSSSSARGSSATATASCARDDFIALASQVSGRDLTGFLRDWLYGDQDAADARAPGLEGRSGRRR